MGIESASPLLLPFVAIAFVVFEVAGACVVWTLGRGLVHAGRASLFAIWLLGATAVTVVGYRQYGLWAAPPAAMSVGLSVIIVYAIAGRGVAARGWLPAAARASVAALLATAVLPLSLMLFVMLLGIDGP